ncbi:MAG: MFS transporter [Bacteroidota bacterium]|nr:MFS transporter [Bacteroidota bacterium]
MAKVILTIQYEIEEGKREEYLKAIEQLKQHYAANGLVSYSVFEQKRKKNSFFETFIADTEEAFNKFEESDDETADQLTEQLTRFIKDGKQKYATYIETN